MRLRSFRVHGFRSIEDSGTCHLASDVTILAGKNESGKSSLLDALSTLVSPDAVSVPKKDKTTGSKTEVLLETTFNLEDADFEQIEKALGIKRPDSSEVTLEWGETTLDCIGAAYDEMELALETHLLEVEKNLLPEILEVLTQVGTSPSDLPKNLRDAVALLDTKWKTDPASFPPSSNTAKLLENGQTYLRRRDLTLYTYLGSLVPPIVLFRSFEDELPDFIDLTVTEETEQPIVKNFCSLAQLDLEALRASELPPHERRNLVEEATGVYSDQFGRFWNQEPLQMGVDIDGTRLLFTVKNPGETYSFSPSQRSKGFKWYVSFFITLSARKAQENGGIVLIDEPGLYLHPKAQSDLLEVLEDMTNNGYQVILATHSPYLIRPDRLDRVRLVVKGKNRRTQVFNSWYGGADKDSITPLVTALGLDMARLFPNLSRYNVIVEGPTDYYYLQAIRQILDAVGEPVFPHDLVFVPCLGHTSSGIMVSLFTGWNLDCVVVLDRKGTKATKALLAEQGFPESRILRIGASENDSTLDLFSAEDAKKYVFPPEFTVGEDKLSVQAKKVTGLSEVIMARRFLDRVVSGQPVQLSPETLDRFRTVFKAIAAALHLERQGETNQAV